MRRALLEFPRTLTLMDDDDEEERHMGRRAPSAPAAPVNADGVLSYGETSDGSQTISDSAEDLASFMDELYEEEGEGTSPQGTDDGGGIDDDEDDDGDGAEAGDGGGEEGGEEEDDETEQADSKKNKDLPDVEKVKVNDGTGSREIDVDFTDRELMKRYVQQAHGAMRVRRREQAANARAKKLEEENVSLREKVAAHDELMSVYETEGKDAFIKKVTGRTIDEHIVWKSRRDQWLNDPNVPHADKVAYLKKEADEAAQEVLERERKKIEKEKEAATKKAEEMEIAQIRADATAAFGKYRFHGKLGDPVRETKLDRLLWRDADKELDSLRKSGVKITRSVLDSVFREAKDTLGAVIEKKAQDLAEAKVKGRAVKAKKAAASVARRSAEKLDRQVKKPKEDVELNVDSLSEAIWRQQQKIRRGR